MLSKVKTIGRNWSLIFYPESTDEKKLVNAIKRLKTPAAISPLHKDDVWDEMAVEEWLAKNKGEAAALRNIPKVGEKKKPHWHVLLRFKGNKRKHQIDAWVATFTDSNACAIVPPDADGDLRYMAHLDDPDKAQYDVADIQLFGGIDPAPLYRQTELQAFGTVANMIDIIKDNDLDNFADFVDAVFSMEEYAPVSSLMKYSTFYDKYLNAYAQKRVSKSRASNLIQLG